MFVLTWVLLGVMKYWFEERFHGIEERFHGIEEDQVTMKNDIVTIKNLVQKLLEEKGLKAGTDGEGESCPSEL